MVGDTKRLLKPHDRERCFPILRADLVLQYSLPDIVEFEGKAFALRTAGCYRASDREKHGLRHNWEACSNGPRLGAQRVNRQELARMNEISIYQLFSVTCIPQA